MLGSNSKNKKKKTKGKNYLTESYSSKNRDLARERERDKRNYKENRNAYYEESMTYEEIREKRRYEKRNARKKTNLFEKVVIFFSLVAIGYFSFVTLQETKLNPLIEIYAEAGTLEKTISGKAKIIRDEKVVYAPADGDVEYYYHEGEKVKNGVAICKIYEKSASDELKQEIEELDEAIVKLQNKTMSESIKQELANVDEYIYGLIDEYLVYSKTDYSFDVYDLKSELESKFAIKRDIYLKSVSLSANKYLTERNLLNETLDYNAKYVYSPMGGIISYYVDGYEENYTPDNIINLKGKYLQEGSSKLISGNKKTNVKAEDAICKIVDNTAWYITATLNKEETKKWTINDKKVLRVKNVGEDKLNGTIVNVLEYNNTNIITFKINEQMNKFMAFRDIEIEVIETEVNGIKIPNTAIESRECVKLPKSCVIQKASNYYVIKYENGMKKQQQIDVAYNGSNSYYVLADDKTVNKGEYVIISEETVNENGEKAVTEKQLMVGENVTLNGVYKAAGTIYKYLVVNVLTSNDTYAIIDDSESSNIILYDKIILDAKAMKDKE